MLKRSLLPTLLPWLLFTFGLLCLTIGSFNDFKDIRWEKYLISIGASVLASGIFALILKTIQFMGVFKEELNNIIFETKFLKNRVDLPQYWEKVTKELVKDKFPSIHNAIMKDVKETYLPTSLALYHDNCANFIEIELMDREKQIVRVKYRSTFTIIPGELHQSFEHPFKNRIICPPKCPDSDCIINSVSVNDKQQNLKIDRAYSGNSLITRFSIPLNGSKSGYKMEIDVTKTYSLKYDNIISYSNGYIQNGFKVQIFTKGVTAKFLQCGTLSDFKTIHSNETITEKHYSELIYKGQGYVVYLGLK